METKPSVGVFLTAEWRELAMINYAVDPALLVDLVPRGTMLDSWRGVTFVSMVGFRFLKTRVLGVPIPFHRNFDEVNLRFYVRRETASGARRGVVFVKEIVPRAAIAWVARVLYNERYVALPMRHSSNLPHGLGRTEGRVGYEWRTGSRWNRLSVEVAGPATARPEDSEESFITEHYWGYAAQSDGGTLEYQVEHPRWKVWTGTDCRLDCDVERLYGRRFLRVLEGKPTSSFVADGSAVSVRKGVPLAAVEVS